MNDQNMTNEEVNAGYRMVSKSYYCFTCDKKDKKLVQVQDFVDNGISCDTCGNNFCEEIRKENKNDLDMFLGNDQNEVDNRPPSAQNQRENVRDRSRESDENGRPIQMQ